jgi:hypothetical protein
MIKKAPYHKQGDGINEPDLTLYGGAYLTVTYWQADPGHGYQPTIYIKNDSHPNNVPVAISPHDAAKLSEILAFVHTQIN